MTIIEQLQQLLNDMTNMSSPLTTSVPGIAVTLQEGGQKSRTITSGVSSIPHAIPVSRENLFEMGSTTKTYTAALILQFEEQGIFLITDTLSAVLAMCTPNQYTSQLIALVQRFPFLGSISIHQFLTHTSGLKEYESSPAYKQKFISNRYYQWSMQELIAIAASENQGEKKFHYSDTNYVVLGLVSEAVKNQPYNEILHAQIIDKIGLTNTYYLPEEQEKVTAQLVNGYTWFDPSNNTPKQYDEAFLKQPPTRSVIPNYRNSNDDVIDVTLATNPSWGGLADGGIVATTQDVAQFAYALFHERVVDRKRLDAMLGGVNHQHLIKTNLGFSNIEVYYGLGIYYLQAPSGLSFWGMMGNEVGYQGGVFYFPKQQSLQQDIIVSYAYNLDAPGPLENLVLNLIKIIELKNQEMKKYEDTLIAYLTDEVTAQALIRYLKPITNVIDKLGIIDNVFKRINDTSIISKIVTYASFFCYPICEPESVVEAKNSLLKHVFMTIVSECWKEADDKVNKDDFIKRVQESQIYRSNSDCADVIDKLFNASLLKKTLRYS